MNGALIGAALELIHKRSLQILTQKQFLLTVGGDHSIALSTISAVKTVYPDICVVWIDAHGDCNTPDTSPSLHYHGMPLAHLLGWFSKHPRGFEWMPQADAKVVGWTPQADAKVVGWTPQSDSEGRDNLSGCRSRTRR